jgi:transcriptional regulator GlxA family with amidase domain
MADMRRIAILVFPDVQVLDVTGPAEVFSAATVLADAPGYAVEIVAAEPGPVPTSSVAIVAERAFASVREPLDTLLIAGGQGVAGAARDEATLRWVKAAAARSRRVASVCSGSFLLAEAGLLDGRRATTHWGYCDLLQQLYPQVEVDPDPIYVRDGNVTTSAGVTAGMDLALAFVEEDLGREVALQVARQLVLFLKRPGGQAQFSAQLAAQLAEREPLRELQLWIADHLNEDLSVPSLAVRAHMSERHFARAFRAETGMTPAAFVEAARIERARIALESADTPVEVIARNAGFGTVETMRRAFRRRLGVAPADYRSRFRSRAEAA